MARPQPSRGASSGAPTMTPAPDASSGASTGAPAPGAPTSDGAAEASPQLGGAADISPPTDDVPVVRTARIVGLEAEELEEMGKVQLAVGMELACQVFEDGQLRTGRLIEIQAEGLFVMIDDLGWKWPLRADRVNPAAGEWVHVAADYPKPGEDRAWDRAHRTSEAQRAEDDRVAAEVAKGEEKKRAVGAPPPPAATVPADLPEDSLARVGVLATWKGPGALAGPWVRQRDLRSLDFAPAGSKGFFPRNVVLAPVHKKNFDIHAQ